MTTTVTIAPVRKSIRVNASQTHAFEESRVRTRALVAARYGCRQASDEKGRDGTRRRGALV